MVELPHDLAFTAYSQFGKKKEALSLGVGASAEAEIPDVDGLFARWASRGPALGQLCDISFTTVQLVARRFRACKRGFVLVSGA